MRHMKWIMLLVLFVMVAGVSSTDGSTSTMKEFNVGRAFAHCVKLTGTNYQIWITGIISTIVGISGVSQLENVRKILEYFESNGHKTIEKIDEELTALISAGKSRKQPGSRAICCTPSWVRRYPACCIAENCRSSRRRVSHDTPP